MIQLDVDRVKIELQRDIAIQVKNEVHKEITIFLKELENKILKMVMPISEKEVYKAIKEHVPEEGTVEYINFWAGINLISFIKQWLKE